MSGAARCPKLYVPNLGSDPEQLGHDPVAASAVCARTCEPTPATLRARSNLLALDSLHGCYAGAIDSAALQSEGVQVIDCELAQRDEPSQVSAAHFAQLLVSLC